MGGGHVAADGRVVTATGSVAGYHVALNCDVRRDTSLVSRALL